MNIDNSTLAICAVLSLLGACGDDTNAGSTLSGFSEAGSSTSDSSASSASSESSSEDSATNGDGDSSSGDGDTSSGDGDSSSGDGDTSSGDGDASGDGDSTGDGDGDGDSTGDGDASSGDGDGDSSSTGDGDGDGDGDSTSMTSLSGGDGDGDGTTTSASATAGDGDGDDGACFIDPFIAEPTEPYVMLVLDKSGSMFDNTWDPDGVGGSGPVTRWNSLYTVVENILTQFDGEIYFGMQIYPLETATAVLEQTDCTMPSPGSAPTVSASLNTSGILPAMPDQLTMSGASDARGGTPARRGIELAVDHLVFTVNPNRERFIILVTDGAANCDLAQQSVPPPSILNVFNNYDQVVHTEVATALADHDIRTYVVGIDISDQNTGTNEFDGVPDNIVPEDKLNELAEDGGTDRPPPAPTKFYNASDQTQLQSDLEQILTELQSCVIPLQANPPLPDETIVEVNGVEIPKVTDCSTENGWVYVEAMPPYMNIELCNAACDQLKVYGEAEVQFFCDAG